MTEIEIDITPVPKPRMVRSDKYKKRPVVESYWAYKDELTLKANLKKIKLGAIVDVIFIIPMPKSWSQKKRQEMNGKPHQERPDGDNLLKALQDCLCKEDNFIWKVSYEKRWGIIGKIIFKNNCN
jgi:Holliday junction resolvase RusA-like endonuclease